MPSCWDRRQISCLWHILKYWRGHICPSSYFSSKRRLRLLNTQHFRPMFVPNWLHSSLKQHRAYVSAVSFDSRFSKGFRTKNDIFNSSADEVLTLFYACVLFQEQMILQRNILAFKQPFGQNAVGVIRTVEWLLIKVQQSLYRSGQALRVPGSWGSQISRQLSHEGGTVVSRTHRSPPPPSPPPQEIFLELISVRCWIDPRVIVGPGWEWLLLWSKIPFV
jgi:hypothetical protein